MLIFQRLLYCFAALLICVAFYPSSRVWLLKDLTPSLPSLGYRRQCMQATISRTNLSLLDCSAWIPCPLVSFFPFSCVCTCFVAELSTCSSGPQPGWPSAVQAEGFFPVMPLHQPRAGEASFGNSCAGFSSAVWEHLVPFLASCLEGSSQVSGACPCWIRQVPLTAVPSHLKGFTLCAGFAYQWLPALQAQSEESVLAWKKIIVTYSHLICPVSRSEHSWPRLWLRQLGALCALCGWKVFWNEKLFRNLMENTEGRAWSVILSQLVETCC